LPEVAEQTARKGLSIAPYIKHSVVGGCVLAC
jgi:hypothetical protein